MKPKPQIILKNLLRDELSKCVKCGSCVTFCPVFSRIPHESAAMRGKIALLQALDEGRAIPESQVNQIINRCLGCLNCKSSCPNGVDVSRVSLLARLLLSKGAFTDWQAAAIDTSYHFRILRKTSLSILPLAIHREKALSSMNSIVSMLHRFTEAFFSMPSERKLHTGKVIVFPGCALEHDAIRLGNLRKIVESVDPDVAIAANFGCCGAPVLGIPDFSLHAMMVKNLFAKLRRANPAKILMPCPTCLYGLGYVPMLYDLEPEETQILSRVSDVYSFLVDHDWSAKFKIDGKFTFHDPCHMVRGLGLFSTPRILLKTALRHDLLESYKEGACCGFGGVFSIRHRDLSALIREARVDQLCQTGAQNVVTTCATCLDSLSLPLSQRGVRTFSLLDILGNVTSQ